MEKLTFILVSFLAIASISRSAAQILYLGVIPINSLLADTVGVTQINCYIQNIASGQNEDTYEIAEASITNNSSTRFVALDMNDTPLTEGPDPTSDVIGRAQGLFGLDDLYTIGFFIDMNIYFPSGPYSGSTIHIVGRDSPFLSHRELSVTGGTEYFRLAKGFATLSTFFGNNSTINAIIQLNITVFRPILL
ncbi:hypothetical protein MLD38_022981 [Melastoma candidum]|uniref:Uncharacterized protein n=1 Tax=Melastoma candidum TaxID=119954 RepID=A0ACB9QM81_9MYRT|nr:hypothetical protein MLD38_022981 [Melastoma candidum]